MPKRSEHMPKRSFPSRRRAPSLARMPTTATDNKQIMERYVAALVAGDADAVGDFFGAAMAHYEPGSVSLEVTGMVAEGDQVTLEWTSRARTPAGEPYENFCIGVFTVRDGRITEVREYMDTAYAHRVAFAAAS